jgi:hypothetical protein
MPTMSESAWYGPDTDPSQWLAALHRVRHLCTRAAEVMPHAKVPGSLILIDAIKSAIDDYAEREMGHREYFWDRPHKAGEGKAR